jgi:hypothetical protein
MFKTEHDFILPIGFMDSQGLMHREGTMRLITAKDEIEVANESKVRRNPAYLSVLLLARVITRLGRMTEITPDTIESLFQTDFNFLQELYNRVNQGANTQVDFTCPHCNAGKQVELSVLFEKTALPEARKVPVAVVTEG